MYRSLLYIEMYDIVLPLGPKDVEIFLKQVEYTKRNCIGHRNIYVVAALSLEAMVKSVLNVIYINEEIFPFKLDLLHTYAGSPESKRNGWYFQQLVKLYAGSILPGILDRWLVVDIDTFFLKPVKFIENNMCLYATGIEHHHPYFIHMATLIPGLSRVNLMSGICHHMIFEQKFVQEIIDKTEQRLNLPFWQAFISVIHPHEYPASGASEYELYFNYILKYHSDSIRIRPLQWKNVRTLDLESNYDYISYHYYIR